RELERGEVAADAARDDSVASEVGLREAAEVEVVLHPVEGGAGADPAAADGERPSEAGEVGRAVVVQHAGAGDRSARRGRDDVPVRPDADRGAEVESLVHGRAVDRARGDFADRRETRVEQEV